jgi:CubicO group peptidase (beta-lactamase class C family)
VLEPVDNALQEKVRQEMDDWQVPGMAVGVWQDGHVTASGFGVTSLETGYPVRPDTIFQIGSISKVFTATLAMRLVEAGEIALDTPVITYLPDLKLSDGAAQRSLTMRHLLTHSSGLHGDWFADFGMGDDCLDKAMAEVHTLEQFAAPGDVWSYCNSGFYIAGAVVERVTGQTFEDVMREMVFQPLGMDRAFFFAHEAIVYPVAVGHSLEPGKEPEVSRRYPLPRAVNAAGGILSNVENMLRFAAIHINDGRVNGARVLSPESVAEMQREQVKAAVVADYYGLGWALRIRDGVKLAGHGGTTNGFQTYLTIVPEKRFAICMLTNLNRGSAAYQRIETWALDHFCGVRDLRPDPIELPAAKLERLAGRYEQPLHDITIAVDDDRLRLDVIDRFPRATELTEVKVPTMHAYPVSEVDFIIDDGALDGGHVDFILSDDGTPRYFRYHGRVSKPVKA